MSKTIIAIDPGKTTGVAAFRERDPEHVSTWESSKKDLFCWLHALFSGDVNKEMVIVVERFDISESTGKLSAQHDALSIIGVLEYLCFLTGVSLVMSGRDAKGFSTDDKLKILGWWSSSFGGHQNDAARHLLRYMCQTVHDKRILQKLNEGLNAS